MPAVGCLQSFSYIFWWVTKPKNPGLRNGDHFGPTPAHTLRDTRLISAFLGASARLGRGLRGVRRIPDACFGNPAVAVLGRDRRLLEGLDPHRYYSSVVIVYFAAWGTCKIFSRAKKRMAPDRVSEAIRWFTHTLSEGQREVLTMGS